MVRRFLFAAGISLALVSTATAQPSTRVGTHTLIVTVGKTMTPPAERRLAVLVLISRDGGAPAGGLATPGRPLTVLQQDSGLYRIKVEIDSRCRGSCAAPIYRVSGSADHRLEVVPGCRPTRSGFVCSRVHVVKVY